MYFVNSRDVLIPAQKFVAVMATEHALKIAFTEFAKALECASATMDTLVLLVL